MKNSYIRKLTITMILTIIAAAGSVLAISYNFSYRAFVDDMRVMAEGISVHIASEITLEDIPL